MVKKKRMWVSSVGVRQIVRADLEYCQGGGLLNMEWRGMRGQADVGSRLKREWGQVY